MAPESLISDLFKVLLPRDCLDGALAMITAYFDDSGTHGVKSDIVLVAGIFGTEGRLAGLDATWKRHLDAPLCGHKDRVSRFHAYDCDNSINEFLRWTRTETDYFRQQLRKAIIDSGVAAYGMACSRKDWDNLISGDLRSVLGDPERFCINQCFVRSVGWAQENCFDPQMTFVFDNRPEAVQRYTGAVYDAFENLATPPPQLVGCAFLNSTKIRPLQASDLIAWELNRYAHSILKNGIKTPAHDELLHLQRNMDFQAQIAMNERIIQIRDHWLNYYKGDYPGLDLWRRKPLRWLRQGGVLCFLIIGWSFLGQQHSAAGNLVSLPAKTGLVSSLHEIEIGNGAVEPKIGGTGPELIKKIWLDCEVEESVKIEPKWVVRFRLKDGIDRERYGVREDRIIRQLVADRPSTAQLNRECLGPSNIRKIQITDGAIMNLRAVSLDRLFISEFVGGGANYRQFNGNCGFGAEISGTSGDCRESQRLTHIARLVLAREPSYDPKSYSGDSQYAREPSKQEGVVRQPFVSNVFLAFLFGCMCGATLLWGLGVFRR